jgi:thiol:disulfide interchange protein
MVGKIVRLAFLFLTLSFVSSAQIKLPVKWDYKVNSLGNGDYDLQFTATIEKGWHLYSQKVIDNGPLPTEFTFDKSDAFKFVGKVSEPKPIEKAEPVFENAIIKYFENKAVFHQKIKVIGKKAFVVKGTINGMSCNDSQCVQFSPPFDFTFQIPEQSEKAEDPKSKKNEKENTNDLKPEKKNDPNPSIGMSSGSGQNGNTAGIDSSHTSKKGDSIAEKKKTATSVPPASKPNSRSWYGIFILGFLGGFAALLTPCVFPMIPMTVSFFTKRSKTKAKGISNALIYSASIIVLYVTLGIAVSAIFGSDALNRISTNVWFNLFFFVLLVVFAISFLGAFEIVLPSSLVNKVDSASDRGGLLGIFFMALALALVSFSCTSAIIGTLLVEAASIGGMGPFWGMLGFAIALSLPFGLFAAFPGWMNSLPKSGGWLNTVKVFLGFLELALAFKFASNADLVVQAGVLTREVFLVIWIVIFGVLGIYMMGWFKLPHDSDLPHLSVGRLLMAIFVFCFTVYLIPGLWGAPLKLISGFPPPEFYSESPEGFGRSSGGGNGGTQTEERKLPEHAHLLQPHKIMVFDDLKYAMQYAKEVNKPIMMDFTGWACVNCRKMESQVWTDPEVKRRLNENVVLVSLYVDDKKELPEAEQKEVEWNGKRTLKTVGNKWSYLQATRYGANSQPQYRIVTPEGERLSDSTGYDPDIQKYIQWLDKWTTAYKTKSAK